MNKELIQILRDDLEGYTAQVSAPNADMAGFGASRVVLSGADFIAGFFHGLRAMMSGEFTIEDVRELQTKAGADIHGIRRDLEHKELARRKAAGLPAGERVAITFERCECGSEGCSGGLIGLSGPTGKTDVTAAVITAVVQMLSEAEGQRLTADGSIETAGQPTRWIRHTLTLTTETINPDEA